MSVVNFRKLTPAFTKSVLDDYHELRKLEMAIGSLVRLGYHADDPELAQILDPIAEQLEMVTNRFEAVANELLAFADPSG